MFFNFLVNLVYYNLKNTFIQNKFSLPVSEDNCHNLIIGLYKKKIEAVASLSNLNMVCFVFCSPVPNAFTGENESVRIYLEQKCPTSTSGFLKIIINSAYVLKNVDLISLIRHSQQYIILSANFSPQFLPCLPIYFPVVKKCGPMNYDHGVHKTLISYT